jgi:porin
MWIADQSTTQRLDFGDSQGVELFYNIALTKWMYLTPDIQFIDPSKREVDNTVIVGTRLNIVF